MAVVKISELVAAGAITGAELMEVVQGGVNKRVTINDIVNFAWGPLSSDRTVDLNGKVLSFIEDGATGYVINPVTNTHKFTGNFESGGNNSWNLNGNFLNISIDGDNMLGLDPRVGSEQAQIGALDEGGPGQTWMYLVANSNDGHNFVITSSDATGLQTIEVIGSSDTQTITLTAANGSVMPHIVGGGSAPTIAAGAGAGTTPTVSIGSGSTDIAGFINITTGTLPTGTNAVVVTITFNTTYGSAPTSIILTPANALTALLSGVTAVCVPQSTISATTFTIVSGSTALTGSTAYKFFYQVIK